MFQQNYVQDQDYVARDDRLLISANLIAGSGPFGRAMGGVFNTSDFGIASTTGLTVTLSSGLAAIAFGPRHYLFSSDAQASLTHDAADANLGRIDIVAAQVFDAEVSGSDAPPLLLIVKGAPASAPSAPALVAGQLGLYQCSIAANATSGTWTDVRPLVGPVPISMPRGPVCRWEGLVRGQFNLPAATADIITFNAPCVIGRYYRVHLTLRTATTDTTQSQTGAVSISTGTPGDSDTYINQGQWASKSGNQGCHTGEHYFQANATSQLIHIKAGATGNEQVWQGGQYIKCVVEDVGLRPPTVPITQLLP